MSQGDFLFRQTVGPRGRSVRSVERYGTSTMSCVAIRSHGWSVIQSTIGYSGGARWRKDWCAPSITVHGRTYNTSSIHPLSPRSLADILTRFSSIPRPICSSASITRLSTDRQSLDHSAPSFNTWFLNCWKDRTDAKCIASIHTLLAKKRKTVRDCNATRSTVEGLSNFLRLLKREIKAIRPSYSIHKC